LSEKRREYCKNNRDAIAAFKKKWLQENPEKLLQYYQTYVAKPENREAMVARAKRDREELKLGYVKTLFNGGWSENIPVELVEAKRIQVQIRRAIKNMTPT